MTTPSIEDLRLNGGLCPDEVVHAAADLLQSQAERIKEQDMEVSRLQREVVNRNQRALAGDKACAVRDATLLENDTLRAEVEAVRKANLDCVDHYNDARAEIDRLREKYTDTYGALDDAARENTSLRAQLATIAATEPVLVVEKEPDYWSGGHFHEGSKPHVKPTKVWSLPIGTKLFTRPMPAESNAELVEALEKLARLGNGEHYGNSDGNMIARDALSKSKGAR